MPSLVNNRPLKVRSWLDRRSCARRRSHPLMAFSSPVLAQATPDLQRVDARPIVPMVATSQAAAESDIIVSARRRDETLIALLVFLSMVGGAEIQRRRITDLVGMAQTVQQLLIDRAAIKICDASWEFVGKTNEILQSLDMKNQRVNCISEPARSTT